MKGVRLLAAVALGCLAPIPAAAQEPVEIEPGQTVTGEAGTLGTPDLYYFVGEAGATVTFEVEAPGAVSMMLLASDGEPMIEKSGTSEARLEAALSSTDVFFVAVMREDAAAYTLTMSGQGSSEAAAAAEAERLARERAEAEYRARVVGPEVERAKAAAAKALAESRAVIEGQARYEREMAEKRAADEKYARDMAAHEAELARLEAERAEYERKMDEYRKAIANGARPAS